MSTPETAAPAPTNAPPFPVPALPTLEHAPADIDWRQVATWLLAGEVGSSSKAILCMILGLWPSGFHPADLDDLRRCFTLIKQVPSLRPHLTKLMEHGPFWAALEARWDALEGAMNAYYAASAAVAHRAAHPETALDGPQLVDLVVERLRCHRAALRFLKEAEAALGGDSPAHVGVQARKALATWDADTEQQVVEAIIKLRTPPEPAPEADTSNDEPDEPEEDDDWDDD